MPRRKKKKEEKEQAFLLLIFLYILGIGLLMGGILWGILVIGLALLVTIGMFPKVGEVLKTLIEGIVELSKKRKTMKPSSTASLPSDAETEEVQRVNEIVRRIEEFTPSKTPKSEEDCENMLVSYLQAFFPKIKRQIRYPNMRIDAVIDNIGIEIKFQPTRYDFHALYSQIEDRLNFLDKIIVVLFRERDRQTTEEFTEKLKKRGWFNNKVFVVSKS